MEIRNETFVRQISTTKILMDGGEEATVKLETETWKSGICNSSTLHMPGDTFSDLEISQVVIAALKLVKEQNNDIDDELVSGLRAACLDFLKTEKACCGNPLPSDSYVIGTDKRLKRVVICENCDSVLESEGR